jgi:hypothetical protein
VTICSLIRPYGEKLVDVFVDTRRLDEARAEASVLPSLQLSDRSVEHNADCILDFLIEEKWIARS